MLSVHVRLACVLSAAALFASPPARAQDANRDTTVTVSATRDVVDHLARRSGDFREEFAKAVEHSMNGDKLQDRAKKRCEDLNESAKKLRDVFNDKKDKNNPAVREQADKVLAAAADVNRVMADNRFTENLQKDWSVLRSDLNALAQIYSLSPI